MAYQSEIEKLEQRYGENPDQWFAALADSYRKAGSLELALEVVRAGLQKRPNYVSGHIVLGRCLLQQPDDAAAVGAFEKVLALDAENVIALKALSEIAERAARLDDAKRWLTRLLEVDPMNEDAREVLSRLQQAPPSPTPPAEAAEAAEEPEATPAAGVERTVAEMPAVPKPAAASPAPTSPAPPAPEAAPSEEFVLEKSEEATVGGMGLEALELAPPATPVAPPAPPAPLAPPAAAQTPAAPAPPAPAALPAPPATPPAAAASAPSGPADEGSGVEHMEFEAGAGAGVPHAEGVENLEFKPPAPGETRRSTELEPMEFTPPTASGGVGSEALPGVAPFDDQLAWGTGERQSGRVSKADVEAAELAHEAALEPLAQELPDAGSAEAPPAGVERRTGGDLPLIFPEEPAAKAEEPGQDGEPPAGAEAAPVVTETMAELYVKQGLVAEAREIYRTLVAQRPGDATLAQRLAALEAPGAAGPRRSSPPVVAAETGGPSVRDFLSQVFGGLPAPAAPPAPPAPPDPPAPVAQAAPPEAAAAESHADAGGAGGGAPTRRASDEVSLAAVFGEEPAPAPRAPGAGPAKTGGGGGSFSFDEFFGGQGKGPDGAPTTRGSAGRTEEDEDDFKRWLKGLKS
jgi:tetratricopeptide (TPR) repeat protein